MLKVYVHYLGSVEGTEEVATVVKCSEDAVKSWTEVDLREEFVAKYNKRMKKMKKTGRLDPGCIVLKFESGEKFSKRKNPPSVSELQSGADLYAHDAKKQMPKTKKRAEDPPKSSSKAKLKPVAPTSSQSGGAASKALNSRAKTALGKGSLRTARLLYEQVLAKDGNNLTAGLGAARIYLKNKRFQSAIGVLMPDPANLKGWATHPEILELLGDAFLGLKKYNEALKSFDTALGVALRSTKQPNTLPAAAKRFSKQALALKVKLATVLYNTSEQDAAIQVLQNTFQETEEYVPALQAYATAANDRGKKADAIQILLKAIVLDPKNKEVKEALTDMVRDAVGIQCLLDTFQIEEGEGVASALAFLATVVKDFGAVDKSILLYEKTVQVAPDHPSYNLNLMHVHEILTDYTSALGTAKRFLLRKTAKNGVRGITNSLVLELLEGKVKIPAEVQWHEGSDSHATVLGDGLPPIGTVGFPKGPLGPNELDHLAIYFTIVKILFVMGDLDNLAALIHIIEPVRRLQELHTTTIRNEHAYYCCIAQLMAGESRPTSTSKNACRPLYICGDSHTLPLSWREITVHGTARSLTPALATGVKAWHLRPESKFYPKVNFDVVTAKIPKESDVVFVFCEIDCREGILVAVEKDRYKDVNEGIEHVIGIYMARLESLIKQRKLRAFIHPVIPVLNETRAMVLRFNKILRKRVKARDDMKWLEFADDLLYNGMLQKKYELDGTHLSPTYVPLLEGALNKVA